MKNKFSYYTSSDGFSLLEVIIAVAIMGIAALGLVKLNQNNMQSVKTSTANIEINAIVNEVQTLLASPEVCELNFLGLHANNSTNNITEIKNIEGQVKLKKNTPIRQGVKISSMRLYDGGPGASDMYPDVEINPNSEGDTYLELKFDKGKQTYTQKVTRKIKIWVKADNGRKVVECRAYGLGGSQVWQRSTTNVDDIYYKDGNVGIGTDQPTSQLEVKGGLKLDELGARPACDNTQRGTFWFTKGAAGTADQVEVCSKKADDTYSWSPVQSSPTPAALPLKIDYSSCVMANYDSGTSGNSAHPWPGTITNVNIWCPTDYLFVALDEGSVTGAVCCKVVAQP